MRDLEDPRKFGYAVPTAGAPSFSLSPHERNAYSTLIKKPFLEHFLWLYNPAEDGCSETNSLF
jgi:hypothetical protein